MEGGEREREREREREERMFLKALNFIACKVYTCMNFIVFYDNKGKMYSFYGKLLTLLNGVGHEHMLLVTDVGDRPFRGLQHACAHTGSIKKFT